MGASSTPNCVAIRYEQFLPPLAPSRYLLNHLMFPIECAKSLCDLMALWLLVEIDARNSLASDAKSRPMTPLARAMPSTVRDFLFFFVLHN